MQAQNISIPRKWTKIMSEARHAQYVLMLWSLRSSKPEKATHIYVDLALSFVLRTFT